MPKYLVNEAAVAKAEELIEARQYVVRSEWSEVQPTAADENEFLERNGWEAYSLWHLGLTDGAQDETKARHAFVFGDLRRLHRSGLMACRFRATQWDHKEIELASMSLDDLIEKLRTHAADVRRTSTVAIPTAPAAMAPAIHPRRRSPSSDGARLRHVELDEAVHLDRVLHGGSFTIGSMNPATIIDVA